MSLSPSSPMVNALVGDSKLKYFSYGMLGACVLLAVISLLTYYKSKNIEVAEDKKSTVVRLNFVGLILAVLVSVGAGVLTFYPSLVGCSSVLDSLSPLRM